MKFIAYDYKISKSFNNKLSFIILKLQNLKFFMNTFLLKHSRALFNQYVILTALTGTLTSNLIIHTPILSSICIEITVHYLIIVIIHACRSTYQGRMCYIFTFTFTVDLHVCHTKLFSAKRNVKVTKMTATLPFFCFDRRIIIIFILTNHPPCMAESEFVTIH